MPKRPIATTVMSSNSDAGVHAAFVARKPEAARYIRRTWRHSDDEMSQATPGARGADYPCMQTGRFGSCNPDLTEKPPSVPVTDHRAIPGIATASINETIAIVSTRARCCIRQPHHDSVPAILVARRSPSVLRLAWVTSTLSWRRRWAPILPALLLLPILGRASILPLTLLGRRASILGRTAILPTLLRGRASVLRGAPVSSLARRRGTVAARATWTTASHIRLLVFGIVARVYGT